MTLTQKGTRAAAATATAKDFLQSDQEILVSSKKVKENDETLGNDKGKREIAEWIRRP